MRDDIVMRQKLVIYMSDWSWKQGEPIEVEIRQWLREFGNHALLNPGWEPHPAVGALTGWVVHPEDAPAVEPFGTNNDQHIHDVDRINAWLKTIGRNRVEWATAHDFLITGRMSPGLMTPWMQSRRTSQS